MAKQSLGNATNKPAMFMPSHITSGLDMVKAVEKVCGKLEPKMVQLVIKAYKVKLKNKPVKRSNVKTSSAFASGNARPKGNTQGEKRQDWSYDRLAK